MNPQIKEGEALFFNTMKQATKESPFAPRPSRPGDVLLETRKVVSQGKLYRLDHRDFLGVRGYTVYDASNGRQVTDHREYERVLKAAGVLR